MAPNGWANDFSDRLSDAANRVSDELIGSSGYKFEVSLGRSGPVLAPWVIAVIALVAVGVLVCLLVLCCRCCCCPDRRRVIMVPQPTAPQPQVITQYLPANYPVSPTSLKMQQPGPAATHGAGVYSDSTKSSRSPPPAYDQEALVQLNDSHKYPLLN